MAGETARSHKRKCRSVADGLSDGSLLDEFEIPHTAAGFREFFSRIEEHAKRHPDPIAVAMEGYNGHVRPLDSLVRARGWRLFNVNNLKLARFKEIFPAPAKSAIANQFASIPGYGLVCTAELAGEIGTIARFRNEGSLALYLGMAALDNSSGKFRGSKAPKHVNTRAKAARSGRRRSPSQTSAAIAALLRKEARRRQETQPSDPRPRPPHLPRHLPNAHRTASLQDQPMTNNSKNS